ELLACDSVGIPKAAVAPHGTNRLRVTPVGYQAQPIGRNSALSQLFAKAFAKANDRLRMAIDELFHGAGAPHQYSFLQNSGRKRGVGSKVGKLDDVGNVLDSAQNVRRQRQRWRRT